MICYDKRCFSPAICKAAFLFRSLHAKLSTALQLCAVDQVLLTLTKTSFCFKHRYLYYLENSKNIKISPTIIDITVARYGLQELQLQTLLQSTSNIYYSHLNIIFKINKLCCGMNVARRMHAHKNSVQHIRRRRTNSCTVSTNIAYAHQHTHCLTNRQSHATNE